MKQRVGVASRWYGYMAALSVVAAFGPYIPGVRGVRTEQIALYAIAVVIGPQALRHRASPIRLLPALVTWSSIVVVATVATLVPPEPVNGVAMDPLLAGLDVMLLPMAALPVGAALVLRRGPVALDRIEATLLVMLAANALIQLWSRASVPAWLDVFWSASEGSVAAKLTGTGRTTGVFNQPLEAGLAASVGVLAAVDLGSRGKLNGRPLQVATALAVVGGMLTISKVFLFVGIPVATLALILNGRWRNRHHALLLRRSALIAAAVVFGVMMLPDRGASAIIRLLPWGAHDVPVTQRYFAGRYGTGGTLGEVAQFVLSYSPVVGYGFSAPRIGASDNAWLEMLVRAGLVGVVLYTAFLAVLLGAALRLYARRDSAHASARVLLLCLTILSILAGLGGPVFTANRAGSTLCLLVGATLALCRSRTRA